MNRVINMLKLQIVDTHDWLWIYRSSPCITDNHQTSLITGRLPWTRTLITDYNHVSMITVTHHWLCITDHSHTSLIMVMHHWSSITDNSHASLIMVTHPWSRSRITVLCDWQWSRWTEGKDVEAYVTDSDRLWYVILNDRHVLVWTLRTQQSSAVSTK